MCVCIVHAMKSRLSESGLLMSMRRDFARCERALMLVLALVQLIAPTWHVCEMGGQSCCPSGGSGESTLHCTQPQAQQTVKPHCNACPKPQAIQQLSATPQAQDENCLAKLLLGMPAGFADAPLEVESTLLRRVYHAREYSSCGFYSATLPPSRAPPSSC